MVWAVDGRPRVVFGFTVIETRIVAIDLISDPSVLAGLQLETLTG